MKHVQLVHRKPAQALPMLALTLLLLLAFSGLAIDGAMAFAWRRNVTNSADAAAMIATRALIMDRGTVREYQIYDAVHDYLVAELGIANPDFSVYYVNAIGQRMPLNNPHALSSTSNTHPPAARRGVSVDVRYTFDTHLMRLLGRPTLTVGATSTTRFGNAGTVTGDFVVPMGFIREAAETIRQNQSKDYILDLGGQVKANNDSLIATWLADPLYDGSSTPPYAGWVDPDDFIEDRLLRSVALRMDPAAPVAGGSVGCPPDGTPTLKGWWCRGSWENVNTRISDWEDQTALALDLIGVAAFDGSLVTGTFVGSREGEIIIVPVLAEAMDWSGVPNPAYTVEYFMALEVVDVDTSDRTMTVHYTDRLVTNGGLMGSNNNLELGDPCEVCVVNLVRDR